MRQLIIGIFFLLFTITGYYAVPLDENRDEIKNNSNNSSSESAYAEKPVILEENKINELSTSTTNAPISSISSTEKFVEIKILETSNTSSSSIKKEPTRTTKAPTRTRTTRTTKVPRTRKTTTVKPGINDAGTNLKQPLTRQDWLKLIENEMATYEKKSGNSPISNKNLTIISERILKYLVENGTQVGISLREQKDGTIKFMKANVTLGDKIYGEGTESKFPPILEFVVQRIQAYFSVYAHEDHSRPITTQKIDEASNMDATLREDTDDGDGSESSTLSNEEVIDQLEDELNEFIGSDMVKNVTQIKLPSLIKTAYEKIQSWFVPSKPTAKEEPGQDSEEASSTENGAVDQKPTKKPSLIKGAYDAIEAILSVFDDIDVSDEEEKVETPETTDPELKESQDDLEETEAIKETVGENLYDFLKLAYTLYDADES